MKTYLGILFLLCLTSVGVPYAPAGLHVTILGGGTCVNNDYGDTSLGTPDATMYANYIYAYQVTISGAGGEVQSINVNMGTSDNETKCAIYTESGGSPDSLVANSATDEIADPTDSAVNTFTYSGTKPTLSGSTDYWIAVWCGTGNNQFRSAGSGGGHKWDTETYGSWPATFVVADSGEQNDVDRYVVVCE